MGMTVTSIGDCRDAYTNLKRITEYSADAQLDLLKSICGQLYIARNISMSHNEMLRCLAAIDRLYANMPEDGN